jgi:AraC-like DNA-binding protein
MGPTNRFPVLRTPDRGESPSAGVARACQVVYGLAVSWHSPPHDRQVLPWFDSIDRPSNLGETRVIARTLSRFVSVLSAHIHRRHHAVRAETHPCDRIPMILMPSPRVIAAAGVSVWLEEWLRNYRQAFFATHSLSLSERARGMIDDEHMLRAGGGSGLLARRLGLSRRALERTVAAETGTGLLEYRTKRRVIYVVQMLRTSDWKVEAIGYAAGWRSKDNMYRALAALTRLTPTAIRKLSDAEAEALVLDLEYHSRTLQRKRE